MLAPKEDLFTNLAMTRQPLRIFWVARHPKGSEVAKLRGYWVSKSLRRVDEDDLTWKTKYLRFGSARRVARHVVMEIIVYTFRNAYKVLAGAVRPSCLQRLADHHQPLLQAYIMQIRIIRVATIFHLVAIWPEVLV